MYLYTFIIHSENSGVRTRKYICKRIKNRVITLVDKILFCIVCSVVIMNLVAICNLYHSKYRVQPSSLAIFIGCFVWIGLSGEVKAACHLVAMEQ
jgi:hypothetical protein